MALKIHLLFETAFTRIDIACLISCQIFINPLPTSKLTQRTLQKQCLSKNNWSRQFFEINAPMGSSSPPNGPQQPSASLAGSLKLHLLALLLPLPSNAMRWAHFDAHQHCALVLITWALHGALHWCVGIHRLDNGHYGAFDFFYIFVRTDAHWCTLHGGAVVVALNWIMAICVFGFAVDAVSASALLIHPLVTRGALIITPAGSPGREGRGVKGEG